MKIILAFLVLFGLSAMAQVPEKHPRVSEVEEKLMDEASRYFSRRFPGEPFFVKVDVTPLRRTDKGSEKAESLPYFDAVSEEDLDEWDDPTMPVSFLRHRVTKVSIELSVPEKFTEEKIQMIKNEIQVYLKLLPFRDDVRVERSLKATEAPFLPPYFYPAVIVIAVAFLVLGLVLRFAPAAKTKGEAPVASAASPMPMSMPTSNSSGNKAASRSSTDVKGDVTFHDPLKLMDIISTKLKVIEASGTFPTLRDIMVMDESDALDSVVHLFPDQVQRDLFGFSPNNRWIDAFAEPRSVTHETLTVLDRLARVRAYSAADRQWETLLIQMWRLGEKSIPFLRKISQDEAFYILHQLPKSISLSIAKKAFPGAWGRVLDHKLPKVLSNTELAKAWLKELTLLMPVSEWKVLESYRRDKELLNYLDSAPLEEERDVYGSLAEDSFVFQVRKPVFRAFDLPSDAFESFIAKFPLDQWALVVANSSRIYVKQIMDALDDRKRVVFSGYLRSLDNGVPKDAQIAARRVIASAVPSEAKKPDSSELIPPQENHAKTA